MAPGAPITVEARLNGITLTLIVDTGADRTVISPEAIERAGLGNQAGRTVQVVGVTGTSTAALVTVPLLDIAGARIGPIVVVAHALPQPFRGSGASGGPDGNAVDGLLGRDVLDVFTLNVDTASGRATLTPR
jgi:predicted aspartyl protease